MTQPRAAEAAEAAARAEASRGRARRGAAAAAVSAVVKGCRVAMGVTMAFMLIIMI